MSDWLQQHTAHKQVENCQVDPGLTNERLLDPEAENPAGCGVELIKRYIDKLNGITDKPRNPSEKQ